MQESPTVAELRAMTEDQRQAAWAEMFQPDPANRAPTPRACHREAWERWQNAARSFRGLGDHLKTDHELRNIRLHPSGYQVNMHRDCSPISRCFRGFSEKSLQAAMRYRDELLAQHPPRRRNAIPQHVLDALGLESPVFGISHVPQRSCFRAFDDRGAARSRTFYYRRISQVEAYAAAVTYREEVLAQRNARRF